MMLVGKFAPDTFTVDDCAALDLEQVAAQPSLRDELSHLLVARVKPMAGEVERKSIDDLGPRQPSDAILRFDQSEAAPELPRARQPGQSTAGDHDVGARHSATHLDRKSTRLNSSHVSISYAVFCLK